MRNFCCAQAGASNAEAMTPMMHRSFIIEPSTNFRCCFTFVAAFCSPSRMRGARRYHHLSTVKIGFRLYAAYGGESGAEFRNSKCAWPMTTKDVRLG